MLHALFQSKLIKRVFSALILIPCVFLIVFMGAWPLLCLVGAAFVMTLYEWISLAKRCSHFVIITMTGFLYFTICYVSFLMLRFTFDEGVYLIVMLFLAIWGSDSLAYGFGKIFGGPKLLPRISPNKTWIGALGAVVGAAGAITCLMLLQPILSALLKQEIPHVFDSWLVGTGVGVLIGMFGQVGDMMISSVKRLAGAKDTGDLIPGHGGLLDRIDSLLLATPVFLLVIMWGA